MHSARCADNLLYDEPPCTDYADPLPPRITRLAADVSIDGDLVSSPVELFHTAAGLPVLLTLAVLMMHLLCCALQSACGSGSDEAYDTFATSARTQSKFCHVYSARALPRAALFRHGARRP